ncbi:hypothetical protein CKAH01_13909 [Colletotrichum kahawae]|uniref:Uncharacterized protein n=1 Tax=Colletotrichum kahawae TaxID=34407 RepID=A0AAE0D9D8_COLKA|nr:hypothetical protein CKAH01_13909 [Colletotrichum kahawae]
MAIGSRNRKVRHGQGSTPDLPPSELAGICERETQRSSSNPSCLTAPDPTPPPHSQFFKRMEGVALAELRFIPVFSLVQTPSLSQNGS